MKKSDIRFTVTLNNDKFPEQIHWSADDSGIEGVKECSSLMISIWDPADKSTLRIDLWTSKMMVDEMKHFYYETLRSMADSYLRATNDKACSDELTAFAEKFARMSAESK